MNFYYNISYMNQKAFLILFSLLFFSNAEASDYIDKGYYVIDLKNRIEWLKCTTGQQWSDKKEECVGEPVKLNQKDVKEANKLLKEQIKGDWRLPNRKELESLEDINDCIRQINWIVTTWGNYNKKKTAGVGKGA